MTNWMKWARGDKPFQNFVLRWIECSFWISVQWIAVTIVARIVYYSIHSVFLSGRMSGVSNCGSMCWIVLLLHRIGRIEETWERSEGHFGETFRYKLIYCFCVQSGVSNITADCLKDFWYSSTSDGYILESCFFLMAFSRHINNAFSGSFSPLRPRPHYTGPPSLPALSAHDPIIVGPTLNCFRRAC